MPFSFCQEAQNTAEDIMFTDEETNQRNQAGEDAKDDVSRMNTNVSDGTVGSNTTNPKFESFLASFF